MGTFLGFSSINILENPLWAIGKLSVCGIRDYESFQKIIMKLNFSF